MSDDEKKVDLMIKGDVSDLMRILVDKSRLYLGISLFHKGMEILVNDGLLEREIADDVIDVLKRDCLNETIRDELNDYLLEKIGELVKENEDRVFTFVEMDKIVNDFSIDFFNKIEVKPSTSTFVVRR